MCVASPCVQCVDPCHLFLQMSEQLTRGTVKQVTSTFLTLNALQNTALQSSMCRCSSGGCWAARRSPRDESLRHQGFVQPAGIQRMETTRSLDGPPPTAIVALGTASLAVPAQGGWSKWSSMDPPSPPTSSARSPTSTNSKSSTWASASTSGVRWMTSSGIWPTWSTSTCAPTRSRAPSLRPWDLSRSCATCTWESTPSSGAIPATLGNAANSWLSIATASLEAFPALCPSWRASSTCSWTTTSWAEASTTASPSSQPSRNSILTITSSQEAFLRASEAHKAHEPGLVLEPDVGVHPGEPWRHQGDWKHPAR